MWKTLLGSALFYVSMSSAAQAQSFGDLLNVVDKISKIEKQNSDKKKESERRKQEEERQRKDAERESNLQSPTNSSSPQNTNKDDGGYGAIFDKINETNAALTNDEKFEALKLKLKAGRPSQQNCDSLRELLQEDHLNTIVFSMQDLIPAAAVRGQKGVLQSCGLVRAFQTYAHDLTDRVPEIYNDAEYALLYAKFTSFNGPMISIGNPQAAFAKAKELYKRSAELGHPEGQYVHARNLKSEGQDKEAFIFFNKAAEQGNNAAIQSLKAHYGYDFVPKNITTNIATQPLSSSTASITSRATQTVPSVMAKDYWVNADRAPVINSSGAVLSQIPYGAPVTTYGEKDGLGKINLTQDQWIKLSELSMSEPPKKEHAQNKDVETMSASPKYIFQTPYNTVRPIFPPRGVKSGHCIFNFSISQYGKPKGINFEFCTDAIFEKSARKALEESRFRNHTNATTIGAKGLVKFRYTDERGKLIPASSKLPDLFAATYISDSIVIALLAPQNTQGEVYYNTEDELHVPSDPNANYFLLESRPLKNNLSVVTRRVGSSGESYSKREFDCKNSQFRYLGDGHTVAEMNAPYDVGPMRKAEQGDVYTKISYDILNEVCDSRRATSGPRKDTLAVTRYVLGSSLNFRDAPNGNKLGSLGFASKVTVYEKQGNWLRISKSSEAQKWVHGDYVSTSKPVAKNNSTPSRANRKLSDAECGNLRIKKITSVKTQSQFDAIERQLTRGGCNSQLEARKRQWDWVQ